MNSVLAGIIGALAASVVWLILLISVVSGGRQRASVDDDEAMVEAILAGGHSEWRQANGTAQRVACMQVVKRLEPSADERRQLLHSRELWANVDHWFTEPGLESLTFSQAAAMVHTLEYPPPVHRKP